MVRFIAGVVLGFVLGTCATAFAVVIRGDNGYATGWTVTNGDDGEEICSDPYIWAATREIECN
jgi:hypothetical protein